MYHPPTTLAPLQVDVDKKGADSDHNILLLAPRNNIQYNIKRNKKTIKVRPIPDSQIIGFENDLIQYDWTMYLIAQILITKFQIFTIYKSIFQKNQ